MSISVTRQRDTALLVAFRGAVQAGQSPARATGALLAALLEPGPEPTAVEQYHVSILRTAVAGADTAAATEDDNL